MDNTTVDTRPRFARLTEGRSGRSWSKAVPAVVLIVALVALLAYLASNISSSSQRAAAAERDSQQTREQMAGLTKQIGALQKDNAIAKSPGRTTVILEPAAAAKKGAKPSKEGASWAAVTWGELPDGKTFMRVNAYGLLEKREGGKDYHLWFQPQSGDPVDVGALEPDQNGSGFAMNSELPAIDQGKQVMLTSDAQNAKQPGDVIAKADLPKLKPTTVSAPPAAAGAEPQAKTGNTSQQMHQSEQKPAGDKPADAVQPKQEPGK